MCSARDLDVDLVLLAQQQAVELDQLRREHHTECALEAGYYNQIQHHVTQQNQSNQQCVQYKTTSLSVNDIFEYCMKIWDGIGAHITRAHEHHQQLNEAANANKTNTFELSKQLIDDKTQRKAIHLSVQNENNILDDIYRQYEQTYQQYTDKSNELNTEKSEIDTTNEDTELIRTMNQHNDKYTVLDDLYADAGKQLDGQQLDINSTNKAITETQNMIQTSRNKRDEAFNALSQLFNKLETHKRYTPTILNKCIDTALALNDVKTCRQEVKDWVNNNVQQSTVALEQTNTFSNIQSAVMQQRNNLQKLKADQDQLDWRELEDTNLQLQQQSMQIDTELPIIENQLSNCTMEAEQTETELDDSINITDTVTTAEQDVDTYNGYVNEYRHQAKQLEKKVDKQLNEYNEQYMYDNSNDEASSNDEIDADKLDTINNIVYQKPTAKARNTIKKDCTPQLSQVELLYRKTDHDIAQSTEQFNHVKLYINNIGGSMVQQSSAIDKVENAIESAINAYINNTVTTTAVQPVSRPVQATNNSTAIRSSSKRVKANKPGKKVARPRVPVFSSTSKAVKSTKTSRPLQMQRQPVTHILSDTIRQSYRPAIPTIQPSQYGRTSANRSDNETSSMPFSDYFNDYSHKKQRTFSRTVDRSVTDTDVDTMVSSLSISTPTPVLRKPVSNKPVTTSHKSTVQKAKSKPIKSQVPTPKSPPIPRPDIEIRSKRSKSKSATNVQSTPKQSVTPAVQQKSKPVTVAMAKTRAVYDKEDDYAAGMRVIRELEQADTVKPVFKPPVVSSNAKVVPPEIRTKRRKV